MKHLLLTFILFAFSHSAYSIGLKTGRALVRHYSNATGVPIDDDYGTRSLYIGLKSRLPVSGTVSEMSNPALLAISELASLFCHSIKKANDPYSLFGSTINLSDPTSSQNPDDLKGVIKNFAKAFWGRSILENELKVVFDGINMDPSTGGNTQMQIMSLCINISTAIPAITR